MYTVDVMKYWEYTDEDLIKKKLYPLLPLQLFNLRKDIEKASKLPSDKFDIIAVDIFELSKLSDLDRYIQ